MERNDTATQTPQEPYDPRTFHFSNNFTWDYFNWNYGDWRDIYCTHGYSIPGERNILVGVIYIAEYIFFTSLYIPSLIVIARSHLFNQPAFKLMFAMGVVDNIGEFFFTFVAGVLSLMGRF